MNDSTQNDNEIRQYLLGQLADEDAVDRLDERLFSDDDFADHVAVVEDELIDDLVRSELSAEDAAALNQRAAHNDLLRKKIAVCTVLHEKASVSAPVAAVSKPSLFESILALFKQPIVAGALAFGAILIVAAVILWRPSPSTELADLKSIYKNERPTEARISEFDYAPLVTRRGSAEEREAARLRRIELALLDRTEKNPNSAAFHELGRFYLTQLRIPDAIKALDRAVSLDSKNVGALNDLGSSYFESAKSEDASAKFKTLATALEKFALAVEIAPRDAASVFNLAQTQQALALNNEARKSWQRYLDLDSSSGWADEARKAIEKLDRTSTIKEKELAAEDTIAAVSAGDAEAVWKIQSQTREMISGLWVPRQLVRRTVDAKARGDGTDAINSIKTLKYVGELERSRNVDFFVSELAAFYETTADHQRLSSADAMLSEGFALLNSKKIELARAKFAESRDLFTAAGDRWLSLVADLWVAHALTDLSKLSESDDILNRLAIECDSRKFAWLAAHVEDWKGNNELLRNEIGRSIATSRSTLARAESLGDTPLINRAKSILASKYESIGEPERSLSYLGLVTTEVAYGNEGNRRWRRNGKTSDALVKLGQYRSAESFANEALTNAQDGGLGNAQPIDDTLRDLITINIKKGDVKAALKFANDARLSALSTQDPAFKAKILRYAMINIAELNRDLGENETALAAYDEVLALQTADSEVRIDQYDASRGRALTLIELGQNSDEQLAKTMQLSEQFRSRILDQSSRSAFLAGERELADAMITNAVKTGDFQKGFELSESARARSLLDFVGDEISIDQLEARFPTVSTVSNLEELQRSLPPNVQLVEYSILKDKLAIWHVTSDKFNYVESPISAKQLSADIESSLDLVVRQKVTGDEFRASSKKLHGTLIGPIEKLLDKQKQLVIIPDGSIGKLPFALLANSNGRYLIEDHSLSYSPSANVFVRMTQTAKQRASTIESLLAVGDPAFDRTEQPSLDALPSAATEARNVAALYTQPTSLVGAEATKVKLLEQLPLANVVHYAGHYVVNESSPANSRLVLAAGGDSPDLRLDELIKLRLNRSMLVVLSACDTNSENIIPGEGSTGIAQKFIATGPPLAAAGNWKVDSESTADLMQAFHTNRRTHKMTSAEALRQAQLTAMQGKSGTQRPPYYWAAFAAIGGYTEY